MNTPGLPDFPKKSTLDRKVAVYRANAEAHRHGWHSAGNVRMCKACNERKK